MPGEANVILYEYPFNERVRTLLRIEDLFEKLKSFLGVHLAVFVQQRKVRAARH